MSCAGANRRPHCRREFLVRCSTAAAAGLAAHSMGTAAEAESQQPTEPLPTVSLGRYRITRLIAGSNPISGFSYLGRDMDQQMRQYFNTANTLEFLQRCQREGIDTHQFSLASKAEEAYDKLRESGTKLRLIGLLSDRNEIKPVAERLSPIAVAHHGGVTDRLLREGRFGVVHDFVKAAKDQGLLAGVSAHNPDCIKRAADEGWEVDFFMACFYYITRPKDQPTPSSADLLEGPEVGYRFYKGDPAVMCQVIRQVKQPCLAFKILGAGRLCATQQAVREAFRFAFENIKPTDAVIVGMYPRHFDQIKANADYTRQLGAVRQAS